jgi:hypothetical protein
VPSEIDKREFFASIHSRLVMNDVCFGELSHGDPQKSLLGFEVVINQSVVNAGCFRSLLSRECAGGAPPAGAASPQSTARVMQSRSAEF